MATIKVFIAQSAPFRSKDQRHLIGLRRSEHPGNDLPWGIDRKALLSWTTGGPYHQSHRGNRCLKGREELRFFEDVCAVEGHANRFPTAKILRRIHQNEARKPHVLHGTCHGPDVSRMLGCNQHHLNVG